MMVIEIVMEDKRKKRRKFIVGFANWCCRCNGRFEFKNHSRVFKLRRILRGLRNSRLKLVNAIMISHGRVAHPPPSI
jgi:hypothetical protein